MHQIDYVNSGARALSTAHTFAKATTAAGPRAHGGLQSALFPQRAASSLEIFFEPMSFEEYPISSPAGGQRKFLFKTRRRATQR
jgi:hypothetical protein